MGLEVVTRWGLGFWVCLRGGPTEERQSPGTTECLWAERRQGMRPALGTQNRPPPCFSEPDLGKGAGQVCFPGFAGNRGAAIGALGALCPSSLEMPLWASGE